MAGYMLTGGQMRDIRETVRIARQQTGGGKENPRHFGVQQSLSVILGEDLAAATDPRTGWTTARAYVYSGDGDLEYRGLQIIVRQRYTGVSGEAGQYGKVERKNGGWDLESLDCDIIAGWEAPEALSIDADPGPGDA